MSQSLSSIELFAWLGEDELYNSGVIGLKQAYTPAGLVPLVATSQEKMSQDYIVKQLTLIANQGKKSRQLCRFVFQEVLLEIKPELT